MPLVDEARARRGEGKWGVVVVNVLMSFRRNVWLGVELEGSKAAWRMCDVGVQRARICSVSGESARRDSWMRS